jgi:hypothetical protein
VTLTEAREHSRNPQAFRSNDRWVVVDTLTGEPIEGHPSEGLARQAAGYCNDHETLHGRPRAYSIEELTP